MAINSAFQQNGKTVSLNTNAAANNSQSAMILTSDFAGSVWPTALRVVNNGTVDIWISITPSGATAAFPSAGTTTAGTPQAGLRLKPGIVEVFGVSVFNQNASGQGVGGFFINSISSVGTQPFDVSPGEGL